jgi:putative hemolysin
MKKLWLGLFLAIFFPTLADAQRVSVATTQIQVTPNSGAYSAGQCLGGVLAIPQMLRTGSYGGTILTSIELVDPAHQTAANDVMTFLVFNVAPTGTYTDHAACSVAAADRPNLVGVAAFAAANCVLDGGTATTVCEVLPNLPLTSGAFPVVSTNLWIVPFVAATPTYGAVTLYFNFSATPIAGS